MIQKKTVLAVIPARGGSKGLPRKNVRVLGDKPLIAWTICAAKQSKYIDRIIVSSDDEEILDIAKSWGAEVPFVRPAELASDTASGMSVLQHAIRHAGQDYDYVVLLQPTSPFRSTSDIDACIDACVDANASSAVAMTEPDKSPYWAYLLSEGNRVKKLLPTPMISNRQAQPMCLVPNGSVYVMEAPRVLQETYLIVEDTIAYPMPAERSVDIDNPKDFAVAEWMLANDAVLLQ